MCLGVLCDYLFAAESCTSKIVIQFEGVLQEGFTQEAERRTRLLGLGSVKTVSRDKLFSIFELFDCHEIR